MCGIAGIWDRRGRIDEAILLTMRDTLVHRGPDDEGVYLSPQGDFGLGHRRLSILDLSPNGRQPMGHEGSWIVHNGEVYNFRQLRRELEAEGMKFSSQSDTEVILKSLRCWGLGAVDRFLGMFAFAVWDEKERRLLLVRDRVGVKPLYYYHSDGLFVFASELKAILRHPRVDREIDGCSLRLYLKLGYIPSPFSIFRRIRKLEPGAILTIAEDGEPEVRRYWDPLEFYARRQDNPGRPVAGGSPVETERLLEEVLAESFKLRLVADVPVGLFLSGGLDSSLVAALLAENCPRKLKTFCIGFEDSRYDEAPHARRVAEYLGTDHHEFYCTTREAMEIIPKLPDIYDEPFGDTSGIPTYLVSRYARPQVKVALSADGGDELFAGYEHHQRLSRLHRILGRRYSLTRMLARLASRGSARALLGRLVENLPIKAGKIAELQERGISFVEFYFTGRGMWSEREIDLLTGDRDQTAAIEERFRTHQRAFPDFLSFMRLADFCLYLPDDILTKVDRATMAVGLEGRDPLLDHRVFELAASLPPPQLLHGKKGKLIIRRILCRHLPEELVARPKKGFAVPLEKWLKGELRHLLEDYLEEGRIRREGIFDYRIIAQEKERFFSGRVVNATRLWLLVEFEMWYEKWALLSGRA